MKGVAFVHVKEMPNLVYSSTMNVITRCLVVAFLNRYAH